MKKLKILHKTDINGGPVYGEHVNLLHQKMTADDDDEVRISLTYSHLESGNMRLALAWLQLSYSQ